MDARRHRTPQGRRKGVPESPARWYRAARRAAWSSSPIGSGSPLLVLLLLLHDVRKGPAPAQSQLQPLQLQQNSQPSIQHRARNRSTEAAGRCRRCGDGSRVVL
jgi:hypothetical protein